MYVFNLENGSSFSLRKERLKIWLVNGVGYRHFSSVNSPRMALLRSRCACLLSI